MLHVVVVGGGPAGLIAAETLAKAGVRTTIVERHPERVRPCAGLLTQAALDELGVPELLLARRIQEAAAFSPTSRLAFVPLATNDRRCGVIRTDLLVTLLRRRAEEAGATMVHGAFRRFTHGPGDYPIVEIAHADGAIEALAADVVIAADGVGSRVAHTLGLPGLARGVAYMERLTLPAAGRAPDGMQVHFGRRVSADRFGWVVPHAEHLVLGVTTSVRYGKRIWDNLAELKKRMGTQLEGAKPAGREAFVFPLERRATLALDRTLFVGDAAGLGAATTLDGLYYASVSGRLAAQTILDHRNLPVPESLATYAARFEAAHGPALAAAADFEQRFFASDKRREVLIDLARDPELQRVATDLLQTKRVPALPFKVSMRLQTRLAVSLARYSFASPKRREVEPLLRAMPQAENYLDLALRTRSDSLTTLPPLRDLLGAPDLDDEREQAPVGREEL